MSLKEAALTPALAQVMCAISKMQITPDQEILLLGCGLYGILITQLLHHHGLFNFFPKSSQINNKQ